MLRDHGPRYGSDIEEIFDRDSRLLACFPPPKFHFPYRPLYDESGADAPFETSLYDNPRADLLPSSGACGLSVEKLGRSVEPTVLGRKWRFDHRGEDVVSARAVAGLLRVWFCLCEEYLREVISSEGLINLTLHGSPLTS